MYRIAVSWTFELYIDADSVEDAKNKFHEMSWDEAFDAGYENEIHEDFFVDETTV